jgi:hypothetical protein
MSKERLGLIQRDYIFRRKVEVIAGRKIIKNKRR